MNYSIHLSSVLMGAYNTCFKWFVIILVICRCFFFTGISASNGRTWREQRRFALSTLRDFGMGKVRLEESILNEANALVKVIEAKNGQPFDVHQTIMTSVCNVIYSMVFGKRYDHNDNELDGFTKRIDENLRNFDRIQATVSILPWLRFLPGDMFKYWKALDNLAYVDDGMMEEIDQHKKSHKPEITRDFIDAYINRMKECSHEEDSTFDGHHIKLNQNNLE